MNDGRIEEDNKSEVSIMIVFSERVVYVGAHVTPEAKRALREIAQTQHVSMSAFIAEAIQEKLEKVTRETHEGNSHSSAA